MTSFCVLIFFLFFGPRFFFAGFGARRLLADPLPAAAADAAEAAAEAAAAAAEAAAAAAAGAICRRVESAVATCFVNGLSPAGCCFSFFAQFLFSDWPLLQPTATTLPSPSLRCQVCFFFTLVSTLMDSDWSVGFSSDWSSFPQTMPFDCCLITWIAFLKKIPTLFLYLKKKGNEEL